MDVKKILLRILMGGGVALFGYAELIGLISIIERQTSGADAQRLENFYSRTTKGK